MGNLNKVQLIGRLTRDPEIKEFSNGGKVAQIGFAVNNRRKSQQSGQWEDVPVWLDVKAFDRDFRKLADLAEKFLRKGQQIYIEGHLVLEEWNAKEDGAKRSKLVIHADDIQFLDKRGEENAAPVPEAAAARPAKKKKPEAEEEAGGGDGMEDIPF